MWHCEACGYHNEDLEGACAKCGAEHVSGQELQRPDGTAVLVPGSLTEDAAVPGKTTPSEEPKPGGSALPLIFLTVTTLMLLGAGYLAWTRGVFGAHPSPSGKLPQTAAPAQGAAPTSPVGGEPQAAATPAAPNDSNQPAQEDPLSLLDKPDAPALGALESYRDYLIGLDVQLHGFDFSFHAPAPLSAADTAALDQLKVLTEELASKYREFETAAGTATAETPLAAAELLRQAFVFRMAALVRIVGQARAIDIDGTHAAYMAPDTLAQVLTAAGKTDAAPLRSAWEAALKAQEEGSRNAKYGAQLAELSRRYDELRRLHNDYQKKFQDSPPYSVKNGILGATAAQLISSFDELARQVESQVESMEEYRSALPADSLSSRMEAVIADFTALAQQDHLYCFTETYKVYAKDRDLSNPAYEHLKEHYEFAKAHWPGFRDQYVGVYTQYEAEWDQRWGTDSD